MALEGGSDLITFDGGALVCDMLVDASAAHTLQLTQFPIEGGATISDHAIQQPFTLELTLMQTETPLDAVEGFSVASQDLDYRTRPDGRQSTTLNVRTNDRFPVNVNQLIGAVTSRIATAGPIVVDGVKADAPIQAQPLRVTALTANAPVERVNEFYANLLSLMLGVTPVNVTVKGATHIDMVITSLTRTDSPNQFGAARFQVQLQRVSTVFTQTVELPPVPEATRKQSRGKKDGKPATPAEEDTIASKLFDKGVDLTDSVVNVFTP